MTHSVLAVDPGKNDAAVALFLDGRLYSCAFLQPHPGSPYQVAKMVEQWLISQVVKKPGGFTTSSGKVSVLCVEGQQVYPGPRRNDPNDLLFLAETVGGVKARIDAFTVMHPLPREWTGSIPKEVRIRRLIGRLDSETLSLIESIKCPKSKLHNVMDAIGLGLWALGQAVPEPAEGYKQ